MWALEVVKSDSVTDCLACMLQALESVPVNALLFQCFDCPLDHVVLLWRVRRNEFLAQTIASHQSGVTATGEDQAVVGSQ